MEKGGHLMGQSIIVAILSIFFYVTSLFGGGSPGATSPQSYLPPAHSNTSIAGQRANVNSARTTVRSGPSSDYPIVTSLDKGVNVVLLAAENGWYQARYASGKNGWIAGHFLDIIGNEIAATTQKQNTKAVLGYY